VLGISMTLIKEIIHLNPISYLINWHGPVKKRMGENQPKKYIASAGSK
jgi:hypothetical protein